MKKIRVALIWGGAGREHEVSRMGATAVLPRLDTSRFSVISVHIDKKGIWHLGNETGERIYLARDVRGGILIGEENRTAIDVAFPLLHGDFGEDGRIQGALDCAGIPYVGCGVRAGAISADKILTKMVADSLGIPTARSISPTERDLNEARRICEDKIGYPMFIKPSGLGSSVGCSAALTPDSFDNAYRTASAYDGRVLVEELVEGAREIECAYSRTERFGEIFAPPGEVIPNGVYTYRAKYGKCSRARVIPRADIPQSIAERAEEYSRMLVGAIGITQIARIDYFLKDGMLMLNEINTMPGFTQGSLYPAMLAGVGIELSELMTALIEDAYDRHF